MNLGIQIKNKFSNILKILFIFLIILFYNKIVFAKTILGILDKPQDLIKSVEDRPGHDFRYSLDSSKVRSELNWSENTIFSSWIGLQLSLDLLSFFTNKYVMTFGRKNS